MNANCRTGLDKRVVETCDENQGTKSYRQLGNVKDFKLHPEWGATEVVEGRERSGKV